MAELDVATTPINRSDVVILFEQRTASSSDNAYFVVRREAHSALCQAVEEQGRRTVQVVFAEDGRSYRLDPSTDRPASASKRLLMHGLTAAALVSAGAVATDMYLGIAGARDRLNQEIALHDDEVAAIRQARERIARLDQTRRSLDRTVLAQRNPADVLDALADALPDHAWLTDVRLTGGIVEIAGISTVPMELPSLMSASETFDKASFQGNVVKAVNEVGERFSMRMEVSR
jgi:Tfp pilus assembly protein PilN